MDSMMFVIVVIPYTTLPFSKERKEGAEVGKEDEEMKEEFSRGELVDLLLAVGRST
jgi:hypothetical protein